MIHAHLVPCLIAAASPAAAETDRPLRIGDLVWAWGNPEMTVAGEHTAATFAQASPRQRAKLLNARRVMMAGHGLPEDDAEAERLTDSVKDLPAIAWEIGPDGGTGPPFVYERRMAQVRWLCERHANIEGVILDDMSTVSRQNGFQPEHIRAIRSGLTGPAAGVGIWGVVYTMSLDEEGIDDYIRELDVILLPEWHGRELLHLERNVAKVAGRFPDKPIILCTYLYDYGAGRRLPLELIEAQFTIALKLAHEGRISGIEITTIDNDEEAVRWTADWIRRVADEVVRTPGPPIADQVR